MFTVAQIQEAHDKVITGADFPKYIHEIKALGVQTFETWVIDSHTVYTGKDQFQTTSEAMYNDLSIAENSNVNLFKHYIKLHQLGTTDYLTFCKHCAETGIEKWIMDLNLLTCTYYDKSGEEVLKEKIPAI